MNDWYIDRSKNFLNESLNPVLEFVEKYDGARDSSSVIAKLINAGVFDKSAGNPNAALTRFRDHGLITNANVIGDSAKDYLEGMIGIDELIIDLFFKRPAAKKQSPDLKPLVLLCHVFWMMFDIASSNDDIFLTASECFNYLYPINSVDDISYELIDTIMTNREYLVQGGTINSIKEMKQNEMTNIRIWFNALKNTPFFIDTEDRNIVKPNVYQRDFFEFIYFNSFKMMNTPTDSNTALYDYYCKRETGINEIIPMPFKPNSMFRDTSEVEIIYKYLFGIKKAIDFDFKYYFDSDCFGVYHPFISVPSLVYRKIYLENKPLGRMFYEHAGVKIDS